VKEAAYGPAISSELNTRSSEGGKDVLDQYKKTPIIAINFSPFGLDDDATALFQLFRPGPRVIEKPSG
jgi:hypothetical protein